MSKPTKKVTIYTDGACSGNPGRGGYGIILDYLGRRKEFSAGYRWTTNNRMELMALIKAFEALKEPCRVEIVSDSKYILDTLKEGRIEKWKRNGWKTTAKTEVLNRDLWEKLDHFLSIHHPEFSWVKGHSVHAENNRCDSLAVLAAKENSLLIDEPYEVTNPPKA